MISDLLLRIVGSDRNRKIVKHIDSTDYELNLKLMKPLHEKIKAHLFCNGIINRKPHEIISGDLP
ncbi:hypothetical protein ASG93_11395 [Paenibacillus sp. Soil787]|nr:hypothetical protein ASG93_11395 [Paenibacillus sp. Soil787]